MNTAPVATPRRQREHLVPAPSRARRPVTPTSIARRRLFVSVMKWLLPAFALALLSTLAVWPELDRASEQGRVAFRRIGRDVGGAQVTDARYRSVDEHGRPYTVTATTAIQVSPERVNLVDPNGDVTQENGTWLTLRSNKGVFMQHTSQLDLSGDVVLYRDDGTTMRSSSASIDLKRGAAAGSEPTHAEGPFGTLDAQGFTMTDKGAEVQFPGPARLLMNAHNQ